MKKNIFKVFLLTLLLGFTLTSCEDDNETWRAASLVHDMPGITNNGIYGTTDVIYLNYITGVNYSNIYDINLRNARINLSTSALEGFSYGDEIYVDEIIINGQVLPLNYYVRVNSDLVGSRNISFNEDYEYMDFMHQAMLLLVDRGRIDVRINGSSRMNAGTLYVVLENDLDVLVD